MNARLLGRSMAGVPRYVAEMHHRLPDLRPVRPARLLSGASSQLWEQTILPLRIRGDLLWSPSTTGPLSVSRQVVTIHDLIALDKPEWFNRAFGMWYRELIPRLARRVRHIITVSNYTKGRLIQHTGIPESKISVIPLAASSHFRPNRGGSCSPLMRSLNLVPDRYVLSVASVEPRKNLGRLLEAWKHVTPRLGADFPLVVVGASGPRHVFAKYEVDWNVQNVVYAGYVPEDDLPALVAGARVFVYPSLYEGFGLPPLEAMASGTACITSRTSSIPEVVADGALLIDPYDVGEIEAAILKLVLDGSLNAEIAKRGIERAQSFSWERTAEETFRLLLRWAE